MIRFLGTRIAYSLLALFGLVLGVFFLAYLGGSPARLYLPENASQELINTYNHQHGFDRPLLEQLGDFLLRVVHLDFGMSLRGTRTATETILHAFPDTLIIAAIAMVVALVLGIGLGALAAYKPFSIADRLISAVGLIGISLPNFWLGLLGVLVLAVNMRWLPTSGQSGFLSWILPVFTLSVGAIGVIAQVARGAVVEALGSGYVQNARARGYSSWRLMVHHALRNAMLPVVSITGDRVAHMFNGTVIICAVFAWPGVGQIMVESVTDRNFPVLQAGVFFIGLAVIAVNLIADLLYAVIDPRIRIS
ncbi:MAG: ABC transporter permease [Propionibacteriaceae bacterium]|jgi:peptide/nickel transport system permease protein|nr:ABC transporter permease [Propionibacteriaceae bacterium]